MPLNFPSTPTNGQQYTYGGVTYEYSSSKTAWVVYVAGGTGGGGSANISDIFELMGA